MDPYDTLGIPKDSTEDVVEKAFKKLALIYHPDKNSSPDATEKFQEISNARNMILNEQGLGINGPGQGQGQGPDMMPEEMLNFLNKVKQINKVKVKLQTVLHITLEEAYAGGIFEVTFDKPELTGKMIQTVVQFGPISFVDYIPETINKTTKTNVRVPKRYKCENGLIMERIDDNTDLYILIVEKEHPIYKRQGSDLYITLTISLKESLLGFDREIIHLNGTEIELDCKNIIHPYMEKRIQDSGFDDNGSFLIIKFHIEFPKELTDDVKKQLGEIL